MSYLDLPDEVITQVSVDDYETILLTVLNQTEEYSQILDTKDTEDIYPMVQEHIPDMDPSVAKHVIAIILAGE